MFSHNGKLNQLRTINSNAKVNSVPRHKICLADIARDGIVKNEIYF
jgi:hypothetical protein